MCLAVLVLVVVDVSCHTRTVGNCALWLRWIRGRVRMFLVVLGAIVVDAYRRASFVAFPAALLSLLSLALLLRIKTSDPRANVAEKRKAGRPIYVR